MLTEVTTEYKVWTILSLIEWNTNHLASKGFDDPRLNVELLLCHVLKCQRIDLYLKFDQMLNNDELNRFKELLKRRLTHEPLQYILGETEFMGLRLNIDHRVLIPRPETEILVEHAVKSLTDIKKTTITILDIGTGSGNIAVSLARFLPNSHIDTIDISKEALEVARINIQRYNFEKQITLIKSDFLSDVNVYPHYPYDVIVSNPPYIGKEEFQQLQSEIKDYEPSNASTDMADGLTYFKAIALKGKQLLELGGTIYVEIGYSQSEIVPQIFQNHGYNNLEVFPDYSGIKRVVKARL